jgi:hypothetical protein
VAATRRSLRRYLAFGLLLLAGALVLVVACVWVWIDDRTGDVTRRHGIPLMVPLTFAVLLAASSFVAGRHARAARRVARANRWVAVPARVLAVPYSSGTAQRSQSVLAIQGLDDRSILVQPLGLRRLDPRFEPVVWTAGAADHRFVVSPPGGGRVLCVEEVRTRRPWRRGREPDPDRPPIA